MTRICQTPQLDGLEGRASGFKSERGVTILELLVALVIIAVAFFAIAAAQLGSLSATSNAREISGAKDFANGQLEGVRREILLDVLSAPDPRAAWRKYADGGCPVVQDPPAEEGINAFCKGSAAQGGKYTAQWVLGPESDAGASKGALVQVRMKVLWATGENQKELGLVSYLSCVEVDQKVDGPSVCPVPEPG